MFWSNSCLVPPELEVNRLSYMTTEAAMNTMNMTTLSVTRAAEANPWRAGCGESRMPGSEGGVGKHSLAVRPAPTLPHLNLPSGRHPPRAMMPKFSAYKIRIWAIVLKNFRISSPHGR